MTWCLREKSRGSDRLIASVLAIRIIELLGYELTSCLVNDVMIKSWACLLS